MTFSGSTMKKPAVISCLLVLAAAVSAQTDHAERALPQWLTGITAVAGFLFLAFITFLVNKAWCGDGQKLNVESVRDADVAMTIKPTCSTMTDMLRQEETKNGYDNVTFDYTEEKVTAM